MSTQKARVDVHVNGQQADDTLDALQGKAKQLKNELKQPLKPVMLKAIINLKKNSQEYKRKPDRSNVKCLMWVM